MLICLVYKYISAYSPFSSLGVGVHRWFLIDLCCLFKEGIGRDATAGAVRSALFE